MHMTTLSFSVATKLNAWSVETRAPWERDGGCVCMCVHVCVCVCGGGEEEVGVGSEYCKKKENPDVPNRHDSRLLRLWPCSRKGGGRGRERESEGCVCVCVSCGGALFSPRPSQELTMPSSSSSLLFLLFIRFSQVDAKK